MRNFFKGLVLGRRRKIKGSTSNAQKQQVVAFFGMFFEGMKNSTGGGDLRNGILYPFFSYNCINKGVNFSKRSFDGISQEKQVCILLLLVLQILKSLSLKWESILENQTPGTWNNKSSADVFVDLFLSSRDNWVYPNSLPMVFIVFSR